MSEFKGTPGPWSVDAVNYHDYGIVSNTNGEEVTTLPAECAEHDFNAMLIAAAPELLEALQKLCVYAEDVCGVSPDDCHEEHPLMSAQAVVAKALGQTK